MGRAIVFLSLLLMATSSPIGQNHRYADHVVLVSVDGLRPEFYLDRHWPAPMMQQMVREGAYAKAVRGVFPSVTYPSHTTLITGALPKRHGVYYNRPFEPQGQTGRWYWKESAIEVPTLWDAVKEAGLKTASVAWPTSVGAPIHWNIPEFWSLDPQVDPVETVRSVTTPPELFEEVQREATGRLTPLHFGLGHLTRDDQTGAIAAYLLKQYRPALLTLHVVGTDRFQHQSGRQAPVVRQAVAAADRAISRIVEAAKHSGILQRTAFIVTGDHGFSDIHTKLAPNVWLVEAGLMEARSDRGQWRATFHTSGGAAFLHLRDAEDNQALSQVRTLLGAVQPLFRLVERPELDRIGADPSVPLALAAHPGISFTSSPKGPVIRATKGGAHGYFPEDFPQIYTGFIGWGAGFRARAVAPILRQEDIAPLVAELLGVAFEAPDGISPRGFLKEDD